MCVKNAMLEELITLEVPLPSARRQLSPLPSRRIINPSSKARRGEREYPPGGIRHLLAPPETRVPCAPTPSPDTYGHPQTRTHGYALPAHADTRTSPVLLPPHCHPPPPLRDHVSQDRGGRGPTRGAAPQGAGPRGGTGPGSPARRCPAPRPGRGESRTSRLLPAHLMEEEGCWSLNPLGAGANREAAFLPSAQEERNNPSFFFFNILKLYFIF